MLNAATHYWSYPQIDVKIDNVTTTRFRPVERHYLSGEQAVLQFDLDAGQCMEPIPQSLLRGIVKADCHHHFVITVRAVVIRIAHPRESFFSAINNIFCTLNPK